MLSLYAIWFLYSTFKMKKLYRLQLSVAILLVTLLLTLTHTYTYAYAFSTPHHLSSFTTASNLPVLASHHSVYQNPLHNTIRLATTTHHINTDRQKTNKPVP